MSKLPLKSKLLIINEGISHIKTLTIGKDTIQVDKNKTYSNDALVITEDTDIFVEFVTEYTVTANAEEGGRITINGNSNTSVTLDENSEITVAVTPDENYQISSVSINGSSETVTDPYSFSKNVTVTGNTEIHAVFVRVYKVQVSYDDTKGIVVTDPVSTGGKVVVSKGSKIEITATPNENYRVSKVTKKKNSVVEFATTFNENNKVYKDTITEVKDDFYYEIVFSLNTFNVTVNNPQHGKVTVDKTVVEYGGSCVVTIEPDSDYTVDKVTVNGHTFNAEEVKDNTTELTFKLMLENINENKSIEVTFKEIPADNSLEIANVSFDKDDAIRKDEKNKLYVYSKNSTVTFTTTILSHRDSVKASYVGSDKKAAVKISAK